MNELKRIIVAFDEWLVAETLAAEKERSLNALAAYALDERRRNDMYNERRSALLEARGKASEALSVLSAAVDAGREAA